jgi:hypothetical protein
MIMPRARRRVRVTRSGLLSAARALAAVAALALATSPPAGTSVARVPPSLFDYDRSAPLEVAWGRTVILDDVARQDLKPGELERIRTALAELKQVMTSTDREVIHEKTHALNHATQHLAEVMMNRTVREALAGKNVTDV